MEKAKAFVERKVDGKVRLVVNDKPVTQWLDEEDASIEMALAGFDHGFRFKKDGDSVELVEFDVVWRPNMTW